MKKTTFPDLHFSVNGMSLDVLCHGVCHLPNDLQFMHSADKTIFEQLNRNNDVSHLNTLIFLAFAQEHLHVSVVTKSVQDTILDQKH